MIDARAHAHSTRYDNAPGGSQHCPFCCDDGLVVASYRPAERRLSAVDPETGKMVHAYERNDDPGYAYEEMGPCPFCAKGYDTEFPVGGRGPWGAAGYWQGRPLTGLTKGCQHGERPIPPTEGARHFLERMGVFDRQEVRRAPAEHPALGGSVPTEPADASADQTSEEAAPAEAGAGTYQHHRCPELKDRDVPWSREECAYCTPADRDDLL